MLRFGRGKSFKRERKLKKKGATRQFLDTVYFVAVAKGIRMVREWMDKIKQGQEVRASLIALKAALKDNAKKHALLYYLNGDFEVFYELLKQEDAKVRKNTAMIMGQLGEAAFLEKLYEAYEAEHTLFVRSSYLSAIREFDYRAYMPQFKERMEFLTSYEAEEGDKKHIREERKLLSELLLNIEGVKKHTFTGYSKMSKIILLTNRNFKNITLEQLRCPAKEFNAGVLAKTDALKEVLDIRTFQELLFVLEDRACLKRDTSKTEKEQITAIGKSIANSSLLQFLKERHAGAAPFYFRIECKSKMDLSQKSILTKQLAATIEELTNRQLINSTSNYEVELRLIENKERDFNFLIKLYTLKDERFVYRKQTISSSIQPVNAALIAALAKDYLVEGGQVLDPFCGVGTMLLERHKLVPANTMYGLDLFGEAIEKARENTERANNIVHYINRDFFDFKHEYLFDEIITNMPRVIGRTDKEEILVLFRRFFEKAKEHLKEQAILVLYVHDKEILQRTLDKKWYKIEKEFEISKKEGAYLYILRRKEEHI